MTAPDLLQLRKLAEEAGSAEMGDFPWYRMDEYATEVLDQHNDIVAVCEGAEECAAFIAAANPSIVLWLLEKLEEARRRVGTLVFTEETER